MDAPHLRSARSLKALRERTNESHLETKFGGVAGHRSFDPPQACLPAMLARLCRSVVISGPWVSISTAYLLPLTAAFLFLAVAALAYRASKRRGYGPFVLGVIAGSAVLLGKFSWESRLTTYTALGLLVVASLWNAWPLHATPMCSECQRSEG